MQQDALSSSKYGNGSDKGIRERWLPLFDRYDADLVQGKTSITISYYHARGADRVPTSNYELFETTVIAKRRRG